MTTAQVPAQAVEVCFRLRNRRRQAFYRPQGTPIWRGLPVPKAEKALRTGSITVEQHVDAPVVSRETLEDV